MQYASLLIHANPLIDVRVWMSNMSLSRPWDPKMDK